MTGKRMTVFLGERDQWKHRPLYLAILEHLKASGCAGATVTKGIAGFGAHSHIKTASLVELSVDLPIVVTVVDRPEKIDEVAAEVAGMLSGGTIVLEDTEVHFYSAAFRGGIPDVRVADVMTRSPDSVTPDTPVVDVVRMLLDYDHTALPVVDAEGRVLGVVGDRDLLSSDPTGRRVRDAMTAPAITIRPDASLKDAAELMHEKHLKRLPVVDAEGRLVGVVARFDILSRIAAGYTRRMVPHGHSLPQEHHRVAEIMETAVPTVRETTPLGDVVEKLLASDVKRVMVVDDADRLVGVVADADLLARVEPSERPGLLTLVRSRWSDAAERKVRRVYGQRAADVMSPPIAIRDDATVMDALTLSATRHVKRLPVVDAAGRVKGIVSRPALLAASLELAGRPPA